MCNSWNKHSLFLVNHGLRLYSTCGVKQLLCRSVIYVSSVANSMFPVDFFQVFDMSQEEHNIILQRVKESKVRISVRYSQQTSSPCPSFPSRQHSVDVSPSLQTDWHLFTFSKRFNIIYFTTFFVFNSLSLLQNQNNLYSPYTFTRVDTVYITTQHTDQRS